MTSLQQELINRAARTIITTRDEAIIQLSREALEDAAMANPHIRTTEELIYATLIANPVTA